MSNTTKFAGWQCPSYGLAHNSPYLGDLPQSSSAYVEGTIPVCIFFQPTSETFEQPVVPAASHAQSPAPPTQLGSVGLAHLDDLNPAPVCLVLDVLSEFPERPRVQLSVELASLAALPDALWVSDCNDSIQSLRLVHDVLGNFVQFVVRDAALLRTDSLYHFQQFLLSEFASQVEIVSPCFPQLPPVELGLARLGVHRTRHVPDSHIYGENRGVGRFEFDLAFDGEVQEVFAVPPEQLGLADFEVVGDLTVWLDCAPDPAATELDWNANPVARDFGVSALDSDEVFSDGERVFSFGLDALVEPLGLLFVRRVEFDAWVSFEEPLESFVFVVEDLMLNVGQPHDLRLDDFLHLHYSHQFVYYCVDSGGFRGERGHRKYSGHRSHPRSEEAGFSCGKFIKKVT